MKWNTKEVQELLSTIPNTRINIVSPGGDVDTESLYIFSTLEQPIIEYFDGEKYENQNAVVVCGLVEEISVCIDNPSVPTVDIAYIELKTLESDSDGGLHEDSSDEIIRIYHAAQKKLRKGYGKTFEFVRHYHEVY